MNEQASKTPIGNGKETSDQAILRQAIIAEYDAVNLYEQMARSAKSPRVRNLLLDVAKEEKVHIGEFEGMLDELDKEHRPNVEDGKKELKDFKEWLAAQFS